MDKKYTVFGANGALGSAIVRFLHENGKKVTAVVQSSSQNIPSLVETIKIDCMDKEKVISICSKSDIIFHCINVPYSKWQKVMPIVTENILAGAVKVKATLVFPGNVYGYGRFIESPFNEDHPKNADSKKGKLRNELEERLMSFHERGNIRLVIPRFPDYYGPCVVNGLMKPIFRSVIKGKKASWIGSLDVLHSLVFIDDAAKACILLANESKNLVYHVSGTALTGREFIKMIYKSTGKKPLIGVLKKNFFRFIGLFAREAKELVELMYEFEEPLVMDGTKFLKEFPSFTCTEHEKAIVKTVDWFRSCAK